MKGNLGRLEKKKKPREERIAALLAGDPVHDVYIIHMWPGGIDLVILISAVRTPGFSSLMD